MNNVCLLFYIILFVNMISNLERLTDVIKFLKIHKAEIPLSNKFLSKEKIENLANELRTIRQQFLQENIKELKQKIKRNYKKIRVSALSLMEYNWNENGHSNILQYIIDYNSFEAGANVLSQMAGSSFIRVSLYYKVTLK